MVTKTTMWMLTLAVACGATGCQGTAARSTGTCLSGTVIPPLSPVATVSQASGTMSSAPLNLGQEPVIPPPAPTAETAATAGLRAIIPPPLAPPELKSGPASQPAGAHQTASRPAVARADCLPGDQQWRQDLESQTQALQSRLSSVEHELSTTRQSLIAVNGALTSSNQKMAELNQEVKHWQGTTRQLESEMKRQQESDLKSLDELSGSLSQLLDRQRALEQGR